MISLEGPPSPCISSCSQRRHSESCVPDSTPCSGSRNIGWLAKQTVPPSGVGHQPKKQRVPNCIRNSLAGTSTAKFGMYPPMLTTGTLAWCWGPSSLVSDAHESECRRNPRADHPPSSFSVGMEILPHVGWTRVASKRLPRSGRNRK
jgi:hypothetical protein